MASKKINWRLANRIADAIADKAFAHLLQPLKAQMEGFGKEAYLCLIDGIDIPLLASRNIITIGKDAQIQIDIVAPNDGSKDSAVRVLALAGWSGPRWEVPCIINDNLWSRANPVQNQIDDLMRKRNAFYSELNQQLEGKMTATAMKAWPEAADIIADIAEVGNPTAGFTTPLDNLLCKYLPMLPAPTPQGA